MSFSHPLVAAPRAPWGVFAFALLALFPSHSACAVAIDLVTNANLFFGRIVATNSAGTVTVSPAGDRSSTGGVLLGSGFNVSAASFTVTGDADAAYSITLPSSALLTSGADSMNVSPFTSSPNGSANLGPGGSQTIGVGATLQVGANQPASSYTGTFIVIVSYN